MTLILLFVGFILVALLVLYGMFYIIFRRNGSTNKDDRVTPKGEQYEIHAEVIRRAVNRVLPVPFEEVSITSRDGLKLYGRYYHHKDDAPLGIFFHGYRSGPILDGNGGYLICERRGYNVLIVTQRAHGKSEGNVMTFGIRERLDCLDWITYANERFGTKIPIILMGMSMGAATVLMAAGEELPENVKGVIADSPFTAPGDIIRTVMKDYKLPVRLMYPLAKLSAKVFGRFDLEETSAREAVKKSKIPILFIHGDDDRFVPCQMSRECYEGCGSNKRILTVEGAGHGLSHCVDAVRYEACVDEFLDEVVGES